MSVFAVLFADDRAGAAGRGMHLVAVHHPGGHSRAPVPRRHVLPPAEDRRGGDRAVRLRIRRQQRHHRVQRASHTHARHGGRRYSPPVF